jgi:uncharacterized membrane protein YbhN (UPF0104 family)
MKKPASSWKHHASRSALVLLLLGGLFSLLLSYADYQAVRDTLSEISMSTLVIASIATAVGLLITAIRWWIFMRHARFPNGIGQIVAVRFIGHLLNTILPTGMVGDVAQVFLVIRRPRISASHALSAGLADRLVGLGGIILLLVVALPWVGLRWPDIFWIAPLAVTAFVLGLLSLAAIARANLLGRSWFSAGFNYIMVLIGRASLAKKGVKLLAGTTLMSLAAQVTISIAPWVLLQGSASVPFLFSLPVLALASLSTLVPITIGGLGIREWILFGAMSSFGLSLAEAIAVSIAWFAVTMAISILLSTISIVCLLLVRNVGSSRTKRRMTLADAPRR